jgi:hypothetical protein
MKISIDIEATPDEVREFFGWPPIQPLQQELIRVMQENMNKGVAGFEPLSLMKSLFPMPMQVGRAINGASSRNAESRRKFCSVKIGLESL